VLEELARERVDECNAGEWLDAVAARDGFVATDHPIEITGLCAECR